jgi:general secretion pathway protein G
MTRRNGFTLVELVVVILILGILAGVAAPKMFSTSAAATDNGLRQTLSVVRDAIELYVAQQGALPTCTGTGSDFRGFLKSYIRGPFPTSPVGQTDFDVKPVTGLTTVNQADDSTGWMYNTQTGEFIANCTGTSPVDGTAYSAF